VVLTVLDFTEIMIQFNFYCMNAYVTFHVHVLIIVYFMFYSFVPSPGVWITIKTLNIAQLQ